MDPDACLAKMRKLVAKMIADYDDPNSNGIDQDEANELADKFAALDLWLCSQGFPPRAWVQDVRAV